ncbi:MAG: ba3-type terminal oxidase subunit CbaD [Halobellus sp.]|uniref:ba3-type terminal oxidase subunit CbaD n=1 Tax=Halobellus sp. TaxID=1979212 RepID=UPI0035D4D169
MAGEPQTEEMPTPGGEETGDGASIPDTESIDDEGYVIGSGRAGVVRQIDHEDFDPIGTLVLIAIYMTIIGAMWIFMYFVEFLGGDLTVIG